MDPLLGATTVAVQLSCMATSVDLLIGSLVALSEYAGS